MRRHRGSAGDLHTLEPGSGARAVHVFEVTGPALVLGSTQSVDVVDRAAVEAGSIGVTVRRSGGGAVLLEPDGQLWFDIVVPRDDELWVDDVAASSDWLGRCLVDALGSLGVAPRAAARDARPGELGRVACFAGVGPGEVLVAGRKVVGISQRRTRGGARFQVAVPRRAQAAVVDLLRLDPAVRSALAERMGRHAGGVDLPADTVLEAVLRQLPT